MATFSQSLTVPSNVTAGGTVQAGDVTTLYNSLNSLTIPDTIASLLVSAYSTDSAITLIGPTTSTSNSANDVTVSFAASKATIHMGAFAWGNSATASATGFALQFFKNNTAFANTSTTTPISTATSGNGLWFMVVGPHDGTYTTPAIGIVSAGTSTAAPTLYGATAALPNAAWTSVGIRILGCTATGSSAHEITVGHQRVWRQV